MTCVQYKDTITLILTAPNEYGSEIIDDSAEVKAAIDLNTGYSHGNNQDAVDSDAIAFVSSKNQFIQDNYNRLEEMLVTIPLFGTPLPKAWYKVTQVNVARDTQLCNQIDHLELLLKKTAEVTYVS